MNILKYVLISTVSLGIVSCGEAPKKEAKALLTYGFANNILESVNIPELKFRIKKIIAKKLRVNLGFDL